MEKFIQINLCYEFVPSQQQYLSQVDGFVFSFQFNFILLISLFSLLGFLSCVITFTETNLTDAVIH